MVPLISSRSIESRGVYRASKSAPSLGADGRKAIRSEHQERNDQDNQFKGLTPKMSTIQSCPAAKSPSFAAQADAIGRAHRCAQHAVDEPSLLSLPKSLARSTASLIATLGGVPEAPLISKGNPQDIAVDDGNLRNRPGRRMLVYQGIELLPVPHHAAHQVPQECLTFGRQWRVLQPILHDIAGTVVRRVDFVKSLEGA